MTEHEKKIVQEQNHELIRLYQNETDSVKKDEYRNKLLFIYVGLLDNMRLVTRHYAFTNDDIRSFALFGLIKALDLFKPDKGAKFETYAYIKINGAIKDHQKREGNEARNELNKHKKYEKFIAKYKEENGGEMPSITEIRGLFGSNFCAKYRAKKHVSIDCNTLMDDAAPYDSNDILEIKMDRAALYDKIYNILSDNKKHLMLFFHWYIWGTKNSKIASIFGIAESRVSQLNKNIITKLKKELGGSFQWD